MSELVQKAIATLNDTLKVVKTQGERLEAVEKHLKELERKQETEKKPPLAADSKDTAEFLKQGYVGIEKALSTPTEDEVIKRFQEYNDDLLIMSGMLNCHPKVLKYYRKFEEFVGKSELRKALDSATAGEGKEWVPTGFSAELIRIFRLELTVGALFQQFDMPQDPYKFPYYGGGITAYVRSQPTEDEASRIRASTPSTGDIEFSTKEIAARVVWSEILEEDSIVPVLPQLKQDIARALAEAVEDAIINGDDSATHLDSGRTIEADSPWKAWKGLRKLASTFNTTYDVTTGTTSFEATDLMKVRALMKKYGVNPKRLAWIVSPAAYAKMVEFEELRTREKAGDVATMFQGAVDQVWGSPLYISGFVPEDLDANGVYSATGNKTIAICVHYPLFRIGNRRRDRVETDRDIETGQYIVVATRRVHFRMMYPDTSTEPIVAIARNI